MTAPRPVSPSVRHPAERHCDEHGHARDPAPGALKLPTATGHESAPDPGVSVSVSEFHLRSVDRSLPLQHIDGCLRRLPAPHRQGPLLTAIDEVTLAQRIEVGLFAVEKLFHGVDDPSLARELAWIAHDGRRAKNHFIEANLRLVDSIAKHYSGRGMPIMGLVRDGNIGLVRAVEKYDFMTGYKFSTHATRWIRQAVHRGMAQPEEHAVLTMRASDIVFYMSALPPRERSILMSRFGLDGGAPQTLDQIAVVQGVTRERVRQIEKRALALLKVLRLERYLRD
ncbi:hypothetical protein E3O28_00980 [Cryobacterium sp. TMT2-14]|nr:hypothetical protein E3O28_00980 [Cryobacterium sp. TMT2-14]